MASSTSTADHTDRDQTAWPVVDGALGTVRPHVHWLIRAAFAGVFLYHGVTKLTGGVAGFAAMMGLPTTVAVLVALAEIAGGALVLLGGIGPSWATRLAGLVTAPVMLGAIVMVHWPRWSFVPADGFPMGGMEFQVMLLAISIYLVVRGGDL